MGEKKYLKWYNKIGYGSGDIAGNVVYAFLTSFMMPYLTDSVGLAAGVVGTLIAVSKLDMMQFMYLWLPLIFDVLIMFALSRMNVEDANKKLKAEKGIAADEITDASDMN